MRQFQGEINELQSKMASLKIDEAGFNEKCDKVFKYFEEAKQQN